MFTLHAPYSPQGDQPKAIAALLDSLKKGNDFQTLLGVTGSGKTFTMANIIEKIQKPTLIIAHNKTLTAQLAQEFREFFPQNAVHYFVSYYDYYQPEAYIVKTGSYIEKEAMINEEIERLRHAATESLLTRRDVIIVASVSCIYGIGNVENYTEHCLRFHEGKEYILENILAKLVHIQFTRSTSEWRGGMFLLKGDILEIWPSSSESIIRLEFFGDTLERITRIEHLSNTLIEELSHITIFPAKHFVTDQSVIQEALPRIREEMEARSAFFESQGKLVEAERIRMRVEYDIEMLAETGYVTGVENYSLYMDNRAPGTPPGTLLDFLGDDFLTFIDESHMTIPQIGGMYAGDRARKDNLIEYGFRLPSARENRPLRFDEFEKKIQQTIFVSATPHIYEKEHQKVIAEQVIRPTGLLDPQVTIEDMEYMVDSLMHNIAKAKKRNERTLITTITKKSSEDLALYLAEHGIKVRYLHSEIDTLERLEILREYRLGNIDVIVGVNLLREGLDLPETSFIGILDAEKIGFLRSKTSLLQIIGRAARNTHGKVIMYVHAKNPQSKQKIPPHHTIPDEYVQELSQRFPNLSISSAMEEALYETARRRSIQEQYNIEHTITPQTIISRIKEIGIPQKKTEIFAHNSEIQENIGVYKKRLELEMDVASSNLDFERAAQIRDELFHITKQKK